MSDDPIYDSMKRQEFRREPIDQRAEAAEALADDLENQIAELQAGMDQAEGRVAELEGTVAVKDAAIEAAAKALDITADMLAERYMEHDCATVQAVRYDADRARQALSDYPGDKLLAEIADLRERKDGAYEERNRVVAALARLFPSGVTKTDIPGWDAEWHGCVYIDTPTGQLSWHFHDSQAYLFDGLPEYQGEWDGHDTPEKYNRVAALDRLDGKEPTP